MRRRDYVGERFGRLVVTSQEYHDGFAWAHAQCDCGNTWYGKLQTGLKSTRSCGCLWRERHRRDVTGERFGKLTVIKMEWQSMPTPGAPKRRGGIATCQCDCGQVWVGPSTSLLRGEKQSCGCRDAPSSSLSQAISEPQRRRHSNYEEYIGHRFGRLVILSQTPGQGRIVGEALCDCGNTWTGPLHAVIGGRTQSCGCLRYKAIVGQRFGLLVVQSVRSHATFRRAIAECLCDCGRSYDISASYLRKGKTLHCPWRGHHAVFALIGTQVERLTIRNIFYVGYKPYAQTVCVCGTAKEIHALDILNGRVRSCGCLLREYLDQKKVSPLHAKEVRSLIAHRRRARVRQLPCDMTVESLQFLRQYFNFCCAICGREDGGLFHIIALDHWIPIASPNCPGTLVTNMLPLCQNVKGAPKEIRSCNNSKKAKDPEKWLIETYGPRVAKKKLVAIHRYFAAAQAFAASREEVA